MKNLEENNLQDEILSMVKDGDINEEEVIDFINDRTCSLKLQNEMAKLQSEYFLKQNPEEKQKKDLSDRLVQIGFELMGIQGKGGYGRVFKIK